jgi:ribA/ribD-fused uncharacterized protein
MGRLGDAGSRRTRSPRRTRQEPTTRLSGSRTVADAEGRTVRQPDRDRNAPDNGSAPTRNGAAAVEIEFYRASEKPYGAFSNLFRRSLTFEGREYPTAEHAYQAGKPREAAVREWLLSAPTPGLLAMAAHGLYTWDIVPDWSRTKFDRMRAVLRAKFTQHSDLRDLLLSTGNTPLVEAGKVDNDVNRTWGRVNGRGRNMLGVLLMELREELRDGEPRRRARVNGASG